MLKEVRAKENECAASEDQGQLLVVNPHFAWKQNAVYLLYAAWFGCVDVGRVVFSIGCWGEASRFSTSAKARTDIVSVTRPPPKSPSHASHNNQSQPLPCGYFCFFHQSVALSFRCLNQLFPLRPPLVSTSAPLVTSARRHVRAPPVEKAST